MFGSHDLPHDLFGHILASLDFNERVRAALVCKAWASQLTAASLVWSDVCIQGPKKYWKLSHRGFASLLSFLAQRASAIRSLTLTSAPVVEVHQQGGTQLTVDQLYDTLLSVVCSSRRLESLSIEISGSSANLQLRPSSFISVACLHRTLRQLDLRKFPTKQPGVHATVCSTISCLTALEELHIEYDDFDGLKRNDWDDGGATSLLPAIASCTRLRSLSLKDSSSRYRQTHAAAAKMTTKLWALSALVRLQTLRLGGVSNCADCRPLAAATALQRLSLNVSDWSKRGVGRLASLPRLVALTIKVPGPPYELPHGLTQLCLSHNTEYDWDFTGQLTHLASELPQLTALVHVKLERLEGREERSFASLFEGLAACRRLRSVQFLSCSLYVPSDASWQHLRHIQALSIEACKFLESVSPVWIIKKQKEIPQGMAALRSCRWLHVKSRGQHLSLSTPGSVEVLSCLPALEWCPLLESPQSAEKKELLLELRRRRFPHSAELRTGMDNVAAKQLAAWGRWDT